MKVTLRVIFALIIIVLISLAPCPAYAQTRPFGIHYPPIELDLAAPVKWIPEHPLHRGLSLLPLTKTHDYGNLKTWHLDATTAITVPDKVDLSRYAVPVGDQGYVGSCTSWATTYTLAGWWANKLGLPVDNFAPMDTYHQVNGGVDQGSWDYLNLAADMQGMVPMAQYAQGNYDWKTTPTPYENAIAAHYVMTGWVPLMPVGSTQKDNTLRYVMEYFLSRGYPLDLELYVYQNMYDATPETAWVSKPTAPPIGAHALVALGYDRQGLWVENSWGTGWGLNGYAELSWDYVYAAVMGVYAIDGLKVKVNPPKIPVYHGPSTLSAEIVSSGIPVTNTTILHNGQEIAFSGKGFKPGEIVRLYWDGRYKSYVETWKDGTFQIEFYDHWFNGTGPHNRHAIPGKHTFRAVGESGDSASITINAV